MPRPAIDKPGRESAGDSRPVFFEFFAGGGMVRAGLGAKWRCLFANDFDLKKAESYVRNWGSGEIKVADVGDLTLGDLPQTAPDLVWASFPCQDLSLAGAGAGLRGDRSGSFWPFWNLVQEVSRSGKAPALIVLENVPGAVTSHKGRDFQAIIEAFANLDFDVGAMIIDAQHFVPQSRPRLFFIGTPHAHAPHHVSVMGEDADIWRSRALTRAHQALPEALKRRWISWSMPRPPKRNTCFADSIEIEPASVRWHPLSETRRLLSMMTPVNRAKVEEAKASGRLTVGAMYRRTRRENGRSVQRVEIRFDDVAGCLRTPVGGSSRQLLLIVKGGDVRSRLISARETARLMGLEDTYELPERYNDAYHLTGDGVVVDVVRYLAENLLEPHLQRIAARSKPHGPSAASGSAAA